jgi:hypothetical protein
MLFSGHGFTLHNRVSENTLGSNLKELWKIVRGQEQLRVVFWIYYVVGIAAMLMFPDIESPSPLVSSLPLWAFGVILLIQGIYLVWVHISLWTCAFNSSHLKLGYVARAYSIISLACIGYLIFSPKPDVGPQSTGMEEFILDGNAQQSAPRSTP